MSLFGGRSNFGMIVGSRGRHKARRTMASPSNERVEEVPEPGVHACESLPGELKRRTMQHPNHGGSQKWSRMFAVNTTGSPRLGKVRKFTK